MAANPIPLAIVITSFDRGGTERQMSELIRRLDPQQFQVHVVCLRREGAWLDRIERHAASLSEFPVRSFRSLHTLAQLTSFARWLRAHHIAVVHACDLYSNIFALPAAWLARVPLRIGSRRGIVSPASTRGLLPLQRAAYRAAQLVVANSSAAADCLRSEGVPRAKIVVIPNGIDVAALPAASRRPHKRVITTVANLRAGKGHDVLLRAAVEVVRRHPDVSFRFVGDGPLRAGLEDQARLLGLSEHISFLGHRDDVGAVLESSDLFAFPSMMEAFPNGVMEAMAAGLPVVATDVGGIPELVRDGENGLLVPAGDAAALAARLIQAIENPEHADVLGDRARRTVQTQYSFDRMVSDFAKLYVDGRHAAPPMSNGLPIRSFERP